MNRTGEWHPYPGEERGIEKHYLGSEQRAARVLRTLGVWSWEVYEPPYPDTGRSTRTLASGGVMGKHDLGRELARSLCEVALGHEPRRVYLLRDKVDGEAVVVFARNSDDARVYLRALSYPDRVYRIQTAQVRSFFQCQDYVKLRVVSDLTRSKL